MFLGKGRNMKKVLVVLAGMLGLSACVTHVDVAYQQQGSNCLYSEKVSGEGLFGRDRVLEKTISYEATQCSQVIASDLKNNNNKDQSIVTTTGFFDDSPVVARAVK